MTRLLSRYTDMKEATHFKNSKKKIKGTILSKCNIFISGIKLQKKNLKNCYAFLWEEHLLLKAKAHYSKHKRKKK